MKWLLFPLAAISFAFTAACLSGTKEVRPEPLKKEIARCYGNTPCNACSSCSACQYCNAGGTCGICANVKTTKPLKTKNPSASSGQCKAITKKGTRCSRSVRSADYCWQHGG